MKNIVKLSILSCLLFVSFQSVSAQSYTKRNTLNFINKTSYIIGEAYDMVYYYGYYTSGYLSQSVNHQNYAKYLYTRGNYRYALYYSDLARTYALRIIYNSGNYWDNYYRPYYSAHPSTPVNTYKPQANNPRPQQPAQNVQYGHRKSTTNVASTANKTNNAPATGTRVSKYAPSTTGSSQEAMDFDTWDRNYYSSEELALTKNTTMPSEKELETAVVNTNAVTRLASDKEVIDRGIKDFSKDITTYKNANTTEATSIAISRPAEFGTTPEVTRSTQSQQQVNPVVQPVQAQPQTPVDTRTTQPQQPAKPVVQPVQAQPQTPVDTRTTQPQQQAKPVVQPVQTQPQTPVNTRTTQPQQQAKPVEQKPVQTQTQTQTQTPANTKETTTTRSPR
jgi:hypothetical protein